MTIVDAFGDQLPNLAIHNKKKCGLLESDYLTLRTYPKVPDDISRDDSGVLLFSGRSKVGKSTFTHWLLHELAGSDDEFIAIDLRRPSENGANRSERNKVLKEVTRRLRPRPLSSGQVQVINEDPELDWWGRHQGTESLPG